MTIKEEIKSLIEKAVKKLGISEVPNVLVEKPREINYGDYSTNIALALTKNLKTNSIKAAQKIVSQINQNKSAGWRIEKIEVAPPGFINFYLSKDFFIDSLKKINKNFGKNSNLKSQKITVEYTNVNPFKIFHIGHLNNNAIGEALSRILEFHGAKVKRVTYQGDVGIHVARAIYAKIKNPDTLWDEAYAEGVKLEEKDERVRKEIEEINKKIYERSDKKINRLYDEGKKWSLDNFDGIYKKLGIKFDYYFFESKIADFGKKIVGKNLGKVFEKGEKGAIIFKGEEYGFHTRVFLNSEGLPTYESKELALAKIKYDKYKYDQSIIVTGNEIKEYFKVVLAAMSKIFPKLSEKTIHISHGMLRLPEGKMSSRRGNIITAESLIGKLKEMVLEKVKNRGLKEAEKQTIAEQVSVGAIKYSILKQSIGSDVIYNFEKSVSFEGDSGPYLQYSLTRALSILKKAKMDKVKSSFRVVPVHLNDLERLMHRFPEIVEKAGKEYQPHYIVLYLTELASAFNSYYSKEKIVDKNDKFSPYKVALTESFSIVMKNGLWLLGIPSPDQM